MPDETVRIQIVLPKALVESVDQLVGRRQRNAFIAEAVAEKVALERLGRALEATAGFLSSDDYPEWETPEKVSAWVRELRSAGRSIGTE